MHLLGCVVIALINTLVNTQICSKATQFESYDNSYFRAVKSSNVLVSSLIQCSQLCFTKKDVCIAANFKKAKINGKHTCQMVLDVIKYAVELEESDDWVFLVAKLPPKVSSQCKTSSDSYKSCKEIKKRKPTAKDGIYVLKVDQHSFQAYCDMSDGGFTLVARFSNADAKNWMQASGKWWYDLLESGNTSSTDHNSDMLSPAFSLVRGTNIKVSRGDDSENAALLRASGCIANNTMRHKISSFGNFRNGVAWSQSSKCHGSCNATFGANPGATNGFQFANSVCISQSDILTGGNVGFWCRYGGGDGAVIMIGGGGATCSRADHGIGITEINAPAFGPTNSGYYDFGSEAGSSQTSNYALNLWIL